MPKPIASSTNGLSENVTRLLRGAFLLVLVAALLFYVVSTLHWPMIQDSAVMHYVVFLMKHGFRPYRDITDNNMPGAYMLERSAMFVFGGGDLGWRLYDFFLLLVLAAAMVVISGPHRWFGAVFGAGLFALRHGSDGLWFAAEREQEMTVLIAVACALLFVSVRRQWPALAVGFGFLVGMAASIKPTLAPFGLLTLAILLVALRRRGTSSIAYLLWAVGGLLSAAALSVAFLLHYGAVQAFLFVLRTVTPVYAGLGDRGIVYLVRHAVPYALLPIIAFAVIPFFARVRGRDWNWEHAVLLLAALCGLFSYFLQRKGFPYHRYMFLAFALLLAGIEIASLLRGPARARWIATAGLVYAMVYVIPHDVHVLRTLPDTSPMPVAMTADLQQLGGSKLQGQVQCFDLILGCLSSLYHQQLLETNGFTGDLLLFPPRPNPATDFYREWFWRSQAAQPAGVIVMTNEDFGRANSFARVALWPEFQTYLANNYTLAVTRTFPREGKLKTEAPEPPATALAYRIYLRNGEPFPTLNHQAEVP